MPADERDLVIIGKIYGYCCEIDAAHERFGKTYEAFFGDSTYRYAVSFCLLQIGELANHISDAFKIEHSDVPWREIRGMRNVVVHEYGSIDKEIVWETATENIAEIKSFCEDILN